MSQLLGLEWNDSEARMVMAASRGEEVVIEQAFSVDLQPGESGEDKSNVDVGGRIASALSARGIGQIETLVAVGRSNIELRQLSLPPAPDEELPEMVRFQAMREFNELNEQWLLDFVPIGDSAEGTQSVLAAAIDPEMVAQIERTCQTANLKPRRLILRPCAAASLLGRKSAAGTSRVRLLIDLFADEADLTVMIDRQVIFLRTTRLSGDPLEDTNEAISLLAEIRRTTAAAHNQLHGRRIESIVLCGQDEQHAVLAKSIEEHLGTPTEVFDPFDGLRLGRELQRKMPDYPDRFAPLLGMALAELEETGQAIDFLHPRRPPEPPKRYATYALVGALVALLVVSFFGYRYWQRGRLKDEIRTLTGKSKALTEEIDRASKAKAAVDEVEKWVATDLVWLDEIRELSEKFRPAKEATLTKLTISATTLGGRMDIEGLAAAAGTIDDVEAALRDESHRVVGTGSGDKSGSNYYSWWFKSSLYCDREEE